MSQPLLGSGTFLKTQRRQGDSDNNIATDLFTGLNDLAEKGVLSASLGALLGEPKFLLSASLRLCKEEQPR
jgi:hypothetical protein